jgi:hypothetical protein
VESREVEVSKDYLAIQVSKELQDQQVRKERLAHKDHKDRRDRKGKLEVPVRKGL